MSNNKLEIQIRSVHRNPLNTGKRSTVKYCEEEKKTHPGSEIMKENIFKKGLNPLKIKGNICPMLSVTILKYYL
jgi:hypothetical protein